MTNGCYGNNTIPKCLYSMEDAPCYTVSIFMKKLFFIGIGGVVLSAAAFGLSYTNKDSVNGSSNATGMESQQEQIKKGEDVTTPMIERMKTPDSR
ncbi:MAG: hypothetical protein UX83_C0010G0024 [Candidatus Wolfebacteria bacterium GW2011_GWE2_47_12]|nr:MAG: hypothetical protein UX83_C0010G0024 [Candidatus Wolfebacteria bacterium GW2011_GWE2_47_12]